MTISNRKKISAFEDDLSILQKNILKMARILRKKQRIFDMPTLFEICMKELPNPDPEIANAIKDLYKKKYFVEGKQYFKSEILQNEKRKNIYNYVLAHPGAHERELRGNFDLGAYEIYVHLAFLVKYGFLRKNKFKNKTVYFPIDFNQDKELETLVLRNESSKVIYDCISFSEAIRLSQIVEILKIPYSTVQFHVNELLETGLIQKIERDNVILYTVPRAQIPQAQIPQTQITQPSIQQDTVEIKREYDYVGGQIRFKVAIRNFTKMTINNVIITLNPSDQFTTDKSQQKIPNFPPNTTKGIDFYLTPLTCGQSKVYGTMTYEDAFGKIHTLTIEQKEISIKCPLVIPRSATQAEVDQWIQNLKKGSTEITYQEGISEQYAFQIGQEQVSALDLNEIVIHQENLWGLYSGQVKVTGKEMVVKLSVLKPHIILDVWAEDLKQTTGFIAYLTNLINLALNIASKTVQKTKDLLQKISNLIKMSGLADLIFRKSKEFSIVSDLSSPLSTIQQLIHDTIPDSALIQPVQVWQSKLHSMFDPTQPIDETVATDLQFEILGWLYKIQEHIKSFRKIYQETFEDLNHASDEISHGLDLIKERINENEKIYGLDILSYLLIVDKNSGICMFEREFGDLSINPDLVSGFLHALQSFGLELADSETSMKSITYKKYKFHIETGQDIRVALITRGTPNDYLISNLADFVTQFEVQFHDQIVHFTGNSGLFRDANMIFDSLFK